MFGVVEDGSHLLQNCYYLIKAMKFDPKRILEAHQNQNPAQLARNTEYYQIFLLTLIAVLFTSSFEPINEDPKEFFEGVKDQEIPSLRGANLNEEEKQLARRYQRTLAEMYQAVTQYHFFDEDFSNTLSRAMSMFLVE